MNNSGLAQAAWMSAANEENQKTAVKRQPIDHFKDEMETHQKSMIDFHGQISELGKRLDEVANRLAPNSYYKNIPVNEAAGLKQDMPTNFSFEHGGIYECLNSVMAGGRVEEDAFRSLLNDFRQKVQFFENYI